MNGKETRLRRILNPVTRRTIILPLDHGFSLGPIPGIQRLEEIAQTAAASGASAVVMHKGSAERCGPLLPPHLGVIVHLSGSTQSGPDPQRKLMVCSVKEALGLGADGVSIHVNLGGPHEPEMLADFAAVSAEARRCGMPLLAMLYPQTPSSGTAHPAQLVAHAARLGAELGADLVKVPYTGDAGSFRKVTEGCAVPVVVAGGPKMASTAMVLEMVSAAIDAGAAGTALGRNVFQHPDPGRMVAGIALIVHEGRPVAEAFRRVEPQPQAETSKGALL